MKNLFLSLGLLLLAGCNPLKGVFTIAEPITLKVTELVEDPHPCDPEEGGCYAPPPKEIEVEKSFLAFEGLAELDFQSAQRFTLKFKSQDALNELKIRVPDGVRIPERRGTFNLAKEQIHQYYDLVGNVDTQYEESPSYSDNETCEIRWERQICDRDRYGRKINCRWEVIIVPGHRWVEYHYLFETKNVAFDLMDSSRSVAHFSGAATSASKIYEFVGECRR